MVRSSVIAEYAVLFAGCTVCFFMWCPPWFPTKNKCVLFKSKNQAQNWVRWRQNEVVGLPGWRPNGDQIKSHGDDSKWRSKTRGFGGYRWNSQGRSLHWATWNAKISKMKDWIEMILCQTDSNCSMMFHASMNYTMKYVMWYDVSFLFSLLFGCFLHVWFVCDVVALAPTIFQSNWCLLRQRVNLTPNNGLWAEIRSIRSWAPFCFEFVIPWGC